MGGGGNDDDDDDDDDDDNVLAGTAVSSRNLDDDDEDDDERDEEEEGAGLSLAAKSRRKKRVRWSQPDADDDGVDDEEPSSDSIEDVEDDEEDGDEDDSDSEEDELQMELRFCDTSDDDGPYLRTLLQQGSNGRQLGMDVLHELGEMCATQRAVGTVVKQEGDDDEQVYAFATVLNVKHYAGTAPVRMLKQRLAKAMAGKDGTTLRDALESGSLGWVVTERIINVPYDAVPPMYKCLQEDLEWAASGKASDLDEGDYDFDQFLLLAPCYPPPPSASSTADKGKDKGKDKDKKPARARSNSLTEFIEFANPEDFVFARHAAWAFTWEIPRPPPRPGVHVPPGEETRPWGARVLIIPRAAFALAVQQLAASA